MKYELSLIDIQNKITPKKRGKRRRNNISYFEIEDIELSGFENKKIKFKQTLERENDTLYMYAYKFKRAKLRARTHWINEGEQNTSYFLNKKININRTM